MLYKVLWHDDIKLVGKVGVISSNDDTNDDTVTMKIRRKQYTFSRDQLKQLSFCGKYSEQDKPYYDSDEELLHDAMKAQRILMKLFGINKCITYDMREFKSKNLRIRRKAGLRGYYEHPGDKEHITININVLNRYSMSKSVVITNTIITIAHEITHYLQLSGIDNIKIYRFKKKYGSAATELWCDAATIKFLHKNAHIIAREFSDIFSYEDFKYRLTNRLFIDILLPYYKHRKSNSINSNSSLDLLLDKTVANINSVMDNIFNMEELLK